MGKDFKRKTDYVKIPLTQEDITGIRKMQKNAKQVIEWHTQFCDAGYALRVKTDYSGHGYEAVLFAGDKGLNKGKALTSRGSEAWSAVVGVLYKHFEICNGGEWVTEELPDSWLS